MDKGNVRAIRGKRKVRLLHGPVVEQVNHAVAVAEHHLSATRRGRRQRDIVQKVS